MFIRSENRLSLLKICKTSQARSERTSPFTSPKSKKDREEKDDGYRVMKDSRGRIIHRALSPLLRNSRNYDATSNKLAMLDNIIIGFIVGQNVDIAKFKKTYKSIIKHYKRYKLSFSTKTGIKINDINVSLSQTTL